MQSKIGVFVDLYKFVSSNSNIIVPKTNAREQFAQLFYVNANYFQSLSMHCNFDLFFSGENVFTVLVLKVNRSKKKEEKNKKTTESSLNASS